MMTDEQLIERIRTGLNEEVEGLHPAADLLERLRSAPAADRRRPLWVPSGLGGAMVLVASVVVVGLVVAVIATVGQHGSSSGGVSVVPAGVPAGARALVARLAVLRRPQTAADRLPASVSAQLQAAPKGMLPFRFPIIPSLTRLAATVNAGAGPLSAVDIYVVVATPPAAPADIVTTLAVAGRAGHRYLLGIPEVVDEQTAVATGGLTGGAVGSAGSANGTRGVNAGVVADGVTRVKWVFQSAGGRPVTVYPKVESNVAVAKAAGLGVSSATWYGSDGHLIASYDQAVQQRTEAAHALAASARQPIAPSLATHFALFRRPVPPPARIERVPKRTAFIIARQGYGLNVTQARFVEYPGTTGYWVIPGSRGVSMAHLTEGGGNGGGNAPVSLALSGGMIITTCCGPGGETIAGLVPDGNQTVAALLANGTSRTLRVIDNVYSITVRGSVRAIIAKDAAGRRTTIKTPA